MRTVVAAAVAALAVARIASAEAGAVGPAGPTDGQAARASGEARALLGSMQEHARVAREVLERARARRRADEIRCSDEALSRADVALRHGREDAAELTTALTAHDDQTAASALQRLRARFLASRDAAVTAGKCIAIDAARGPDQTQVTVHAG
jgi:hypothetical protein